MAVRADAVQNPSMAHTGAKVRIVFGSILVILCTDRLYSQDAVALSHQGLELMNQGRFREAESPLLQALKLAGPEGSTAIYNLGSLYQHQRRFLEAERLHRRALELIERKRGPFHPEVAQ